MKKEISNKDSVFDNLKAANEITKKMYDLEEENKALKKENSRLQKLIGNTAEDCNIGYLINIILRKMDENHQPMLVTVIDDMIVDIHSKEFEPKKPAINYASYYGIKGKGVTL